jgi:hypothetical protein
MVLILYFMRSKQFLHMLNKSLFVCTLLWVSVITNAQVTLFSASEYRGLSLKVNEGSIYQMSTTPIGNDRLGSIIIPQGYMVTLYEHTNFRGYAETFDASILNMPERLLNQVSSMVITRTNGNGWVGPEVSGQAGWNNKEVVIFSECYYRGASNILLPANYPSMPNNFHRMLSSIKIPAGYEVDLFSESNFRGRTVRLRSDQSCVPSEWNNIVASAKVFKNNTGYLPPDNYDPWTGNGSGNSSVIIYNACEFRGIGTPLTDGQYAELPYGIRNSVYSIRIPQGKEVYLYSGKGFTGSYMQLIGDRNCMISNNEFMINSIKIGKFSQNTNTNNSWNGGAPPRPTPTEIIQEEIEVFNDCYFRGRSTSYKPGEYPSLLFTFANNISSIKVPANRRIILYTGINYTGSSYILTKSNSCLMGAFNNKIRSAIVEVY